MSHSLQNASLSFELHPAQASWRLRHQDHRQFDLARVRMRLEYGCAAGDFSALERWRQRDLHPIQRMASPHGPLQTLEMDLAPDPNGLACTLTFALPDELPLFLWKVAIHNQGRGAIYPRRITLLQTTLEQAGGGQMAFFSNGWGSWNHSGAFGAGDTFRRTRLGPFTAPTRVNAGTPQPGAPGHFGSDMFGVLGDRATRKALLAGFLSQLQHFGSLEARLDTPKEQLSLWANGDGARLDPGESISTDWACLSYLDIDDPEPLAPYLDAVARQHDLAPDSPRLTRASPTGWCSWYQYYQKIDAGIIRDNLAVAAQQRAGLPLEVIQIDDGFQTHAGDWLQFRPGFPHGVAPLAAEIKQAGFTPGLWLAPFILQRRSQTARRHPEWLLRGRFNRPVNAGFIWNAFTTALDITHPGALDYAAEVVHTAVHEWGYPYLKLDFLYAAALPGRYRDPKKTRAQALRRGLERLREAAGADAFLLACGCPLGSAVGLVEAMRVGGDVAGHWHPVQFGIGSLFKSEPDLPSARNAIQNALTRAPMHRHWWANDPDCLLLRPDTNLTLAEAQSLATVTALTDGALFLSDDLTALPEERLRIAQVLLPLIGGHVRILDWFDETTPRRLRVDLSGETGDWHVLALFNWDDAQVDACLKLAEYDLPVDVPYVGREFWSGDVYAIDGGELVVPRLPAHGVALLALRRFTPGEPHYLGGDLHISQGQEVAGWDWDSQRGELRLSLQRPGRARGQVDLLLPGPLQAADLDGRPVNWHERAAGQTRFYVDFEGQGELRVRCKLSTN